MTIKQHLDFALLNKEVQMCAACKQVPPTLYGTEIVTSAGKHAVGGLIGLCYNCWEYENRTKAMRKKLCAKWRKTAPPCIQVVKDKPIQLVVRGKCDDLKLAKVIESTFDKVPDQSRKKILDYVLSNHKYTVTGQGMRFEALGQWPGIGNAIGMNMDRGHAIRLRASYVNECMRYDNMSDLIHTIAHELGHTEQEAEDKSFETENESELDVEARLEGWGIGSGQSIEDRDRLLANFDAIIRLAKSAKKEVASGNLPSGNYLSAAFTQADMAMNNIIRATDRWKGF